MLTRSVFIFSIFFFSVTSRSTTSTPCRVLSSLIGLMLTSYVLPLISSSSKWDGFAWARDCSIRRFRVRLRITSKKRSPLTFILVTSMHL
ncbi:MAG TPA: hypothetical protein P5123_06715 [Spirochaetota bacterium]|nr:hypothetical protein [Spirochaetota bacterium]